jgi:hypothetical protein
MQVHSLCIVILLYFPIFYWQLDYGSYRSTHAAMLKQRQLVVLFDGKYKFFNGTFVLY